MNINTIKQLLEHYLAWFKAHERLVALLAIGFFGVHFYGKGLDYLVKRDQTQVQIAKEQALIAVNKVSADDTANKLLLAQLATMQQQLELTNKRIDQGMQQRAIQTTQQKKVDDQSAPAELAVRIHTLVGVGNVSVSAPLGDSLIFSLDASHAVANQLEDLSQARLDVVDLNTKVLSCQAVTSKQTETITGLNGQIADGKTALVAEQKSHLKEVSDLKLEKKKSWLNGFKWGVITGVVGSLFVHKP